MGFLELHNVPEVSFGTNTLGSIVWVAILFWRDLYICSTTVLHDIYMYVCMYVCMHICMYVIVIQWRFVEYGLYTHEARGCIAPEGECVYNPYSANRHCITIIYPALGVSIRRELASMLTQAMSAQETSSNCCCLCVTDVSDCLCPKAENCSKCSENCPAPKRKKLSLKGKQRANDETATSKSSEHFQFIDDDDFEKLKEGYKPVNTSKSTKWALRNFDAWRAVRTTSAKGKCPDNLLNSTDPALLSHWLAKFAAETRSKEGKPYPPSTVYQLLTGILRAMRDSSDSAPNFSDKGDRRFQVLHKSLDKLFRDLRTKKIGTSIKHSEIFTKEEEQSLWESGILGTSNPKSLLNAVFFVNGRNFCLRGGEEHRRLAISQLSRHYDPDHYVYTECGSKNLKGTFTEKDIPNKIVPIYSSGEAGERCHVRILDFYLSKLPQIAFNNDVFYVRPLSVML